MTDEQSIGGVTIAEGLTRLLREKTGAIDRECERFLTVGDAEALHDLRVAIRRLHTLFSGFSPCFREDSTQPGRLRALQKETNTARDLEVTLALMETLQLDLPPLQQQWQQQLESEYRRLRESIPGAWRELSAALASPEPLLDETLPAIPLGTYAASLAAAEEKKFLRGMKLLGRKWDKQRAHKVRIRGKRVRYLLEPFAGESESTAAAVTELKQVQDLLGDYHDIVVLRQRLRRLPGNDDLVHTGQRERARRRLKKALGQLRKTIQQRYRGKTGRQLREVLEQARSTLAQG